MKRILLPALLLIASGLNACEMAKSINASILAKQKVEALDELVWSLESYYSNINEAKYANLDTTLIEAIKNEQDPELRERLMKTAARYLYRQCLQCGRPTAIIERMLSEIKGLANVPVLVDRQRGMFDYILHGLISLKEVELVKLFLKYGADPLRKSNNGGGTAFDQYTTRPKFEGGYNGWIKTDFAALSVSVDLELLPILYNHPSCDEATRKKFQEVEQRIFNRERQRILEQVSQCKLEDLPAIFNNENCLAHIKLILREYYEGRMKQRHLLPDPTK